jgi:hypothetical protein
LIFEAELSISQTEQIVGVGTPSVERERARRHVERFVEASLLEPEIGDDEQEIIVLPEVVHQRLELEHGAVGIADLMEAAREADSDLSIERRDQQELLEVSNRLVANLILEIEHG